MPGLALGHSCVSDKSVYNEKGAVSPERLSFIHFKGSNVICKNVSGKKLIAANVFANVCCWQFYQFLMLPDEKSIT